MGLDVTTPFDRYVPSAWTRVGLEVAGYSGFLTFASLASPPVTKAPGIYVVLRSSTSAPVFLERSPAGKVLDHTEAVDVLQRSWLDEAEVV